METCLILQYSLLQYYNNKQLKELISDKNNSKGLSLLHMNICSLPFHIDEFTSELNSNFKNYRNYRNKIKNQKISRKWH